MTKEEFLAILDKNLNGTATDAERRLLDEFYRHQLTQSEREWAFSDSERIRMEIFEALNQAIDAEELPKKSIQSRRWLRVAASVTILLAAALTLYLTRSTPTQINYITTSTQRGEQRTETLPDGSIVHLNAESSIIFPETFTSTNDRNIQLTGEAFFEVAKDETKPFVIHSANLITTVLGTSFNVRAYPEESTVAVTVATGRVSIRAGGDDNIKHVEELLAPGEQGVFDKLSTRIEKSSVNAEKYLAWKDGTILMENTSLEEAAEILGRWYNAEFVFRNPELKKCTIDGKFRNDQLENILENLRFLVGLEYRIEPGNRIVIDGKSCH